MNPIVMEAQAIVIEALLEKELDTLLDQCVERMAIHSWDESNWRKRMRAAIELIRVRARKG